MEVKISDIKAWVRKAIDEIALNDADFLSGQDETELDAIIESKIEESVDYVHLNARAELLAGDCTVIEELEAEEVLDVTDMLRLVLGKRDDWKRGVSEMVMEGTQEYAIATDEYVGASIDRPAVLCSFDGEGRTCQLLPDEEEGYVIYISKCAAYENENNEVVVKIDSNMKDAVVNWCSGLVLMTFGDGRGDNLMRMTVSRIGGDVATN